MSGPRETGAGPQHLLVAEDVHKAFGHTPALSGASLTVKAGEIVAIMGPSGSGKSTLLHCLASILRPDHGTTWFDGQRTDQLGDTARTQLRRRSFGFVFQFGQLVPELTAEENVAIPLLLNGTRPAPALQAAREWLDRLGLAGAGKRRAGELSGGQAQRVALGRGLITKPRILFADEPTGSLDTLIGEQVMQLLTDSARAAGTAVLLVTHEPRVAGYADRQVIVRDGRIGLTPADLVAP